MALRPTRLAQANGQTDACSILVGHSKLPIQFGKIIISLFGFDTFPITDQTDLLHTQITKNGFQGLLRIKTIASGIIWHKGGAQYQLFIIMLGNVPLSYTVTNSCE